MAIEKDTIELLRRVLDWDLDSESIKRLDDNNDYFTITGIDIATQETIEGYLYQDDRTNDEFDFERYLSKVGDSQGRDEYKPFIALFQNYKREQQVYKSTLKKYKNNDLFIHMWESKISVYTASAKQIKLKVNQDGINYVEYGTEDTEGYIYNMSIAEILKIVNVTGKNLYRDNVRVGISRSEVSKRLKTTFKDYILSALMDDEELCNKYENVKDRLEKEIMVRRNTCLFWYSHNGITIFSKKKDKNDKYKLNRNGSYVTLHPLRISVINGAQTITNFYNAADEIQNLIIKTSNDITERESKAIVDRALETLEVKTIIINGPADYVSKITLGLNTQIPVGENEQVVGQKETVDDINKILEKSGIKIVRTGEYIDEFWILPQKFVKMYLVVRQQPGRARNFDKNKTQTIINEAKDYIDKHEEFAEQLKKVLQAEGWWRTNSEYRFKNSKTIKDIMSNACYYYCGFWLIYSRGVIENSDESETYHKQAFDKLVDKIQVINIRKKDPISSNDFKRDELFELIKMKFEADDANTT